MSKSNRHTKVYRIYTQGRLIRSMGGELQHNPHVGHDWKEGMWIAGWQDEDAEQRKAAASGRRT